MSTSIGSEGGGRVSGGAGSKSDPAGSVPAPVDLSDHVSILRYLHDRFCVGDMETIRSFCSPDFKHFPGALDASTPKGYVHPIGVSFVRPSFGFDDFIAQMVEMNEQMDWGANAKDFFTSPTTSEVMVRSELSATGKNTGKKISFTGWESWKFNEKHQLEQLHCLYDPANWKQIL